MSFAERLNQYMKQLGCKNKELADAAGLSASLISRYRSGSRTPKNEDAPERLAAGLSEIARVSGAALQQEEILAALREALTEAEQPDISEKLTLLMEEMDVSVNSLAAALNYDSSTISRIRGGLRRPADFSAFVSGVAAYVLRRNDEQGRSRLAALIGCGVAELADKTEANKRLSDWLCSGSADIPDHSVSDFVAKLDSFNLDEYIESIHFNDIKVPTVPFTLPGSRSYYGIAEMRQGELDFLKTTALAPAKGSVFMCSDMPMDDMAEDMSFNKKWMLGIAAMLRKGLNLTIVHNLDRPFHELMLGLQSWIPMYMTGQLSPYYLAEPQNKVYNHLLYVSGAAALSGECIAGGHADAKYYLTKNRDEREYYGRRAEAILKKAKPLMEIYRSERKEGYQAFLEKNLDAEGVRHGMLVAPPLWTMNDELLERILRRNQMEEDTRNEVRAFASAERARMLKILSHSAVFDELHAMSREEFEKFPAALPLSNIFCKQDITYSFEEYSEHLAQMRQAAEEQKNYHADFTMHRAFRNIQIHIFEGRWAVVSKNKAPMVHFVIRHPQLRRALENMIPAVIEE